MPTPVVFESSTDEDFLKFVPEQEDEDLIRLITERLGTFPLIGRPLAPPEAFARTAQLGKWRVFYEVHYGEDDETITKIGILRVVPARVRLQVNLF